MSVARHLVALLGLLGILLCAGGGLGVWYVESRIDRVREQVFEKTDQAFADIERRLTNVQDLAARSKITFEEVRQSLGDWTRKEAGQRLIEKANIEQRAQQLTANLQQAELVLELSQETIEHIRQALELGGNIGLSLNADAVNPLLERMAEIRDDLSRATDIVESLGQRLEGGGDDKSMAERMEQAAKLVARFLATIGEFDSRIASFQTRVTEAQNAMGALNAKVHTRVIAAAVCTTLFLVWMGAGQLCLWRWARGR